MSYFTVHWTVSIEADTPEDAAHAAREIQLSPDCPLEFNAVDVELKASYSVDLKKPNQGTT